MLLPLLSFLQEWIDNYALKNKEKPATPIHTLTKILQNAALLSTSSEHDANDTELNSTNGERVHMH